MKHCLVLGAVFLSFLSAAGESNTRAKRCDEHPERTEEDPSVHAINRDVGLATIYESYAVPKSGIVHLAKPQGGEQCDYGDSRRGEAALAVGALLYEGRAHCSAVLVGLSTAITAGHCVHGVDKDKLTLVFGDRMKSLVFKREYEIYGMSSRVGDKLYDPARHGVNDIAFLELKEQVINIPPVHLPGERDVPVPPGRRLLYVGFGRTDENTLYRRCVEIAVDEECEDSFTNQTPRLNTCYGDSGGAVFMDSDSGPAILVGITTWGDEKCRTFGVSTKTQPHRAWILDRTKDAQNVPARWTMSFDLLGMGTKVQSSRLLEDYQVPSTEVSDQRGGVELPNAAIGVNVWHSSGWGLSVSVFRYDLGRIEGQSPGGNLPYWGAPDPFSVERRVVSYGLGGFYRWRRARVIRPFLGTEFLINRIVDSRTGRYTESQGFSRCALYQADEDEERNDFGCETEKAVGFRAGIDVVPGKRNRKWRVGWRLLARADDVQGRYSYSLGAGVSLAGGAF